MRLSARGIIALLLFITAVGLGPAQIAAPVRPPAVPLVTHDPYFCIWSMADKLTDEWPKHWTGKPNGMMAMVMVDGKPFRIMGPEWRRVPALAQTAVRVYPTRTVYSFSGAGVEVTLTFLSPLLIDDLDIMSRPVTYVTFDVRSADNQPHAVSFYYDACAEIAVNSADQKVIWSRFQIGEIQDLSLGS